jgi:hypothetical protein
VQQDWASQMATLPTEARAAAARQAGHDALAVGGCSRTLQGLADFAIVQSYLSTAAKWGISKLDALRSLFNGRAWLPPAPEPSQLTQPVTRATSRC